jgi:hypothetical protein
MATGPALYLGRQGATGDVTGEHFHFTLKKDGRPIPLSTARTDVGQYLQYRVPGSEQWVNLYTENKDGGFTPAPGMEAPQGGSAFGMREKHPVHGDRRMHFGEDYALPKGTQLRFLGEGSVSTHAGRGGAGNVSALRLPSGYELETLHLSELPGAATTRKSTPDQPATDASLGFLANAFAQQQDNTGRLVDALLEAVEAKKKPKTVAQQLSDAIIGNALNQALTPQNFLNKFMGDDAYLQGSSFATGQFLSGNSL